MIRLTVLGSCGTYPAPGRACTGFLLEAARVPSKQDSQGPEMVRIWIDAGAGTLANLLRYTPLSEVDAIWISHLHMDHCSDLPLANYALRHANNPAPGYGSTEGPRVPVFGPPGWAEHVRAFMSAADYYPLEDAFEVHELVDEKRIEIGSLELMAAATVHGIETFGLRATLGKDTFSYSADSGPCDGLTRLAENADLFLCEAAWPTWPQGRPPIHMTPKLAGEWAADLGARKLVLTHLRPGHDPKVAIDRATQAYGDQVEVVVEGLTFELGKGS